MIRDLVVHADDRGSVRETFRASWADLPPIRQVVRSESVPHTLRGMHAHRRQYDVWHFVSGTARVQTYDHRSAEHSVYDLDAGSTLIIPPGVSHGFYTATGCILVYLLTEEYDRDAPDEHEWYAFDDPVGAHWFDAWPEDLYLSQRDQWSPTLEEFTRRWG